MKVLYDHQIFSTQKFGGISRYFLEIMKIQDPLFTMDRIDPGLFPEPYSDAIPRSLFSRGIKYAKKRLGFKEDVDGPVIPKEVTSTLTTGEYDIFHPTYYDPYFIGSVKKPFVLTVYDMIHEIYKETFSMSDPTSGNKMRLCNKAAAIITISQNTKADLMDILKIDEKKIHAIPLASDFDKVEVRIPEQVPEMGSFILFTGSRWTYKNFYFSAIAMADILKADKTLQLLCTGHAFSAYELEFFRDLGIGNQVKHLFLKNDGELAWAYRNAKAFIFPSLYEGFGFPLLEAFACDCPVVASRTGSLPEVGGDGVLFFEPKNIAQIQAALASVLYNPEIRRALIEKGRRQFTKFSWEKCRAETMEIYKSVNS